MQGVTSLSMRGGFRANCSNSSVGGCLVASQVLGADSEAMSGRLSALSNVVVVRSSFASDWRRLRAEFGLNLPVDSGRTIESVSPSILDRLTVKVIVPIALSVGPSMLDL